MSSPVARARAAVKRRRRHVGRKRRRVRIEKRELRGARRALEHARQRLELRQHEQADERLYGGSRAITNEAIRIVAGRARVTSRKRAASDPLSIANPGSDHSAQNTQADAVDFGIATAYSLGAEIARRLGGSWSTDYQSFTVRRDGHSYRVQIIAGTHGTGPHLHVGVLRVA